MPNERPTKRSRVSRACDQCRTAREKCDGAQPICLTCSASKRACTYTSAPKKRGIQPGYIRTLELALTWLFQNTDSEILLNGKLAQEGTSSVLLAKESKESNRLYKSWRRSKFCRDVDKLLSGEQIDPTDDRTPKSDDEDSDVEGDVPTLHNQSGIIPPEEDNSPITHFTSPIIQRPLRHSISMVPSSAEGPNPPPNLPTLLPSSSFRLLDIYFAFTQSWLPICEKHDVLRVSYSYPETGLILSATDLANPGDHAELWSILAVAAHQARLDSHEAEVVPDSERLCRIARALIPSESGSFTIGHVKALLNLAVVSLGRTNTEAAWLMVGSASRILTLLEHSSQPTIPRWKHLLSSCFLLDSFLSLQLRTRPYFQSSDIGRLGEIDEDGLEEWQPWSSPLHLHLASSPRTPTFSLSSFNKLLHATEMLNLTSAERLVQPGYSPQQLLSRLESWKVSLPTQLGYVANESKPTPVNPPALLLQLTYLCTSFAVLPSQAHFYRILNHLEQYRDQLGVLAIPSIIVCLLKHMQMSSAYCTIESGLRARLQSIVAEMAHAWSSSGSEALPIIPALAPNQARPSFGGHQMPTPESIQIPFTPSFTPANRPSSGRQRASTSLLDDLLPDMNPATVTHHPPRLQNFDLPPLETDFRRPQLHHRNSAPSHDLEAFFDELASLDGAEKVDNQPQFMQNLGFAPDSNMADFLAAELGQFIPANSTTFMPQTTNDPTQIDPTFFGAT